MEFGFVQLYFSSVPKGLKSGDLGGQPIRLRNHLLRSSYGNAASCWKLKASTLWLLSFFVRN